MTPRKDRKVYWAAYHNEDLLFLNKEEPLYMDIQLFSLWKGYKIIPVHITPATQRRGKRGKVTRLVLTK